MSFEMLGSRYLNPYFGGDPTIGTRAITLWLGAVGIGCGLFLFALDRVHLAKKVSGRRLGLSSSRSSRLPVIAVARMT
jgi:hypothetical protein